MQIIKTINTLLFITEYNNMVEKFEAISRLPHSGLYSLDYISLDNTNIAFHCSEYSHGETEQETYFFSDEQLNRSLEEWAKHYEELHQQKVAKQIAAKEIQDKRAADYRKTQYEQLKKEFGDTSQ